MKKIASPQEVQAELRSIMAFVHASEKPDREVVAQKLRELADRVAAIPRRIKNLPRGVRNEGVEEKAHELIVKFKTERDANKFEDRAKEALGLDDPEEAEDSDYDVSGGLDPKTGEYRITISF